MPTATPLTDAINALTQYANETTGASDTTLSDAVGTLVAGYGGGGSGWTTDGIATNTEPNGALVLGGSVTAVGGNAFRNKRGITSVRGDAVTQLDSEAFRDCTNITEVAFPNITGNINAYVFANCTSLAVADLGKPPTIQNNSMQFCTALRTLILRRTSVTALASWSANSIRGIYDNPTESTIYVPSALISIYQTASNWSSAYAAGVTFTAIEGSQYE